MKLYLLSLLTFLSSLFSRSTPQPTQLTISITPELTPTISIIASPSATPTPKPLSFSQMNDLYGPCTNTPVLMYHHISTPEIAKAGGFTSLSVYSDSFDKQMSYLSTNGYITIAPPDLLNFFNSGTKLPNKAVLITFDDAYSDFGEYAVPIMNKYGFKATLFAPTGLLENPGYLTWSTITGFGGNFYIGNHTWSHHNVAVKKDIIVKEVSTAQTQLSDHGLDPLKVFAYPYGTNSTLAANTIKDLGVKMAFTTVHGRILCAKQILTLPRIRIGNGALSSYGL